MRWRSVRAITFLSCAAPLPGESGVFAAVQVGPPGPRRCASGESSKRSPTSSAAMSSRRFFVVVGPRSRLLAVPLDEVGRVLEFG